MQPQMRCPGYERWISSGEISLLFEHLLPKCRILCRGRSLSSIHVAPSIHWTGPEVLCCSIKYRVATRNMSLRHKQNQRQVPCSPVGLRLHLHISNLFPESYETVGQVGLLTEPLDFINNSMNISMTLPHSCNLKRDILFVRLKIMSSTWITSDILYLLSCNQYVK